MKNALHKDSLQVVIQVINALHHVTPQAHSTRVNGLLPATRRPLLFSAFQYFHFQFLPLLHYYKSISLVKSEIRKMHLAYLK
jgi:hypothetical protein